MSGTFPPSAPTTLTETLAAYVYQQYGDDEDIQAFNAAFNTQAQQYITWFATIGLPIYPGAQIAGALLDWIAGGVYGLVRPALPFGSIQGFGLLNAFEANQLEVNQFYTSGVISNFVTTDDIFKRIITWFFYKGDGQQFSIEWIKRRVMRFLVGTAGTAPNLGDTYPVSIAFGPSKSVTITVTLTTAAGIPLTTAQILQAAIQSRAVCLPFQWQWLFVIVNLLTPTNLANDGGVLQLTDSTGWPTSPTGLPAGAVWSNGGTVAIIPGIVPNPFAAPVYFGIITSAALLVLGGGNLPLSNPGVGSGQLWNAFGEIVIA